MNASFLAGKEAGPVTIKRSVGFGYDALRSPYINPNDVKTRYPILDIDDSKVETKSENTLLYTSDLGSTLVEISKEINASLNVSGKYKLFSGTLTADFKHTDTVTSEYVYYKHMGMHVKRREFLPSGEKYRDYLNYY